MKRFPILTSLTFSAAVWLMSSCEQDIAVDLPPYEPKLVVEGWIEQGKYPTVILTESAAYFDPVDSAAMRKSVITSAKVSVSDGMQEEILTLKKKDAFFPSYIYEGDQLKGEVGKTYSLKIESRGKYILQKPVFLPELFWTVFGLKNYLPVIPWARFGPVFPIPVRKIIIIGFLHSVWEKTKVLFLFISQL